MKYYECDMCGEICKCTATFNPLKDAGWMQMEFDVNGVAVEWKFDKETGNFYSDSQITTIQHYCPLCSIEYGNLWHPFMPRRN